MECAFACAGEDLPQQGPGPGPPSRAPVPCGSGPLLPGAAWGSGLALRLGVERLDELAAALRPILAQLLYPEGFTDEVGRFVLVYRYAISYMSSVYTGTCCTRVDIEPHGDCGCSGDPCEMLFGNEQRWPLSSGCRVASPCPTHSLQELLSAPCGSEVLVQRETGDKLWGLPLRGRNWCHE